MFSSVHFEDYEDDHDDDIYNLFDVTTGREIQMICDVTDGMFCASQDNGYFDINKVCANSEYGQFCDGDGHAKMIDICTLEDGTGDFAD